MEHKREVERGIPVDAVWDIETAEWDRFVCGALWTVADGVQVYRDEDDLARALLSLPRGSVAWAHAGGRFDVLWLLDWCRRKGDIPTAQIRMSGASIASLSVRGGPVLRDSCRLIPMALREACTMFPGTAQKERLDLDCVCGRDCGGYCSIRVDMSERRRARLEDYLAADIESLRGTLFALSAYAEASDLILSGTVASTAWRTAKERCELPDTDWPLDAYTAARAGYYGGRVEVGQTRAARVYRFDRVQAYPAALCRPVPTGVMRLHKTGKSAMRAWLADKPGIYNAVVQVPEMMAPPLPLRLESRIVYPWGKVEGSWTRDELARAEEVGAKILSIGGGVTWSDERPLLKPHVQHCFELREAAEAKALKTWLKFVANSLTGAFAQDPTQDVVALGDYADDPRYEPVGRYDWIWRRQVFRISARAHVHWAATLTADARGELHREICHADDAWVYSDTDSCIATRKLARNTGAGLGQWKFEGEARSFEALAPKVYSYRVGRKRHARAKGIPDAEREWHNIVAGREIKLDRGVDSLLVAARSATAAPSDGAGSGHDPGDSRLFRRRDGKRRIVPRPNWCGGRLLDGTRTRAPHVGELASLPK